MHHVSEPQFWKMVFKPLPPWYHAEMKVTCASRKSVQRLKSAENTERLGWYLLVLMKSVFISIITAMGLIHSYFYKNRRADVFICSSVFNMRYEVIHGDFIMTINPWYWCVYESARLPDSVDFWVNLPSACARVCVLYVGVFVSEF